MKLSLEERIHQLELRNKRVEIGKSWEVSWTRRSLISLLTYLIIVLYMWFFELPNPFVNALVPALAFLLSGPTMNIFKSMWTKKKGL
jgi:hypothetical protein